MNKTLLFLLSLLSFSACNNSNSGTDKSTVTDTQPVVTVPAAPTITPLQSDTLLQWIGAYYKLDDKYSFSKDTALINSWWKSKLAQVELYGKPANLFSHNGGGPNGAEWNSSTDLFIVASCGYKLISESVELRLNGKVIPGLKLVKQTPLTKTGTLLYLRLPQEVWEKELRDIQPGDLEALYGKENLESLTKTSATPLQTGRLVDISVHITQSKNKAVTLRGLFHVAYGE